MEEEHQPIGRRVLRGLKQILLVLGCIYSLWVLSYGPALSLTARRVITLGTFDRIYDHVPLRVQTVYQRVWLKIDPRCRVIP